MSALAQYKHKRDFGRTPEPRPRKSKSHRKPIFVIQEHHASRLHYDFRLEADGVLKSWAVPKKPTLQISKKRLAVHVEDHPLEYAKFSGEIPQGEYGAGKVKIWDKGTYENLLAAKPRPETVSEAIKHGHVEVRLDGKRLKGSFALVRMERQGKKDNWLLIKMKESENRGGSKAKNTKTSSKGKKTSSNSASSSTNSSRSKDSPPESIKFTNEDKIMFPDAGITKGDVLRYYERIADRILPHLRDRPITLERLPDGLNGDSPTHFWQKDTPEFYPSWIPRVDIKSEDGETVNYALVNDAQTLLYMVNQGTITFHPWFSRVGSLDQPDYVLFDLDRSKAKFSDVVEVAKALHRLLKRERIKCYAKTSGKSGLHVLVPWLERGVYRKARDWALEIANQLVEVLPDVATTERSKAKRGDRVYVDVMQNVRGHHAVPPYTLRPVSFAGVSTPLRWNEVTPKLDPTHFNLKTIFRRLAQQKSDPVARLVKSFSTKK
jgi:bifunctional non-homologous end joining protein LigD